MEGKTSIHIIIPRKKNHKDKTQRQKKPHKKPPTFLTYICNKHQRETTPNLFIALTLLIALISMMQQNGNYGIVNFDFNKELSTLSKQ